MQAQWNSVNSNTNENLKDVFFIDSLAGYCVGGGDMWGSPDGNGVILETEDGGENWVTIFSQDSLSIEHIIIVNENNNTKLYAFALKNGSPRLISTFLSSEFQNWSVESTSYSIQDVQVSNNDIYFLDAMDQNLKSLQNGLAEPVQDDVSIFTFNEDKLVWLNQSVDSVFISVDNGESIHSENGLPQEMGGNQITNALIAMFGDTLLIKGTYPGLVTKSVDQGFTWDTNFEAPDFVSCIVNTEKLYGMDNLDRIQVTTDSGETWIIQDSLGVKINRVYFYNESMGFAVGEDGSIFKTTNGGGITSTSEIDDLKKKINVFPNPTSNRLEIELHSGLRVKTIKLFSQAGQLIQWFSSDQRTIYLSDFSDGTYFLVIETKHGSHTERFVVQSQ